MLVKPTPLPSPKLVAHSPAMAVELGLREEQVRGQDFVRYFSGDSEAIPELKQWCDARERMRVAADCCHRATPYALCIYGRPMFQQDPFGNGNGYGAQRRHPSRSRATERRALQ